MYAVILRHISSMLMLLLVCSYFFFFLLVYLLGCLSQPCMMLGICHTE